MTITVRPATLSDITYIDSLQRANAEELAFYPRAAFEREIPIGRIILAEIDDEPCGYLYHGAFSEVLKIHQACIQYDLRDQLYGSALIRFLNEIAEPIGVHSILLRCGSDIAANGFWKLMGFKCVAVTQGGVRRMRDINHWKRQIQPELFDISVEPSKRKQDASLWRKRSIQLGSQFLRGRALRQYRQAITTDKLIDK